MLDVSVNIVSSNTPELLNRAVRSVLRQNNCNFEIVIVDTTKDGIHRDFIRSLNDDSISYYHEPQKHLADARNIALENSAGRYVAVLDGDDEWVDNEKLYKQFWLAEVFNVVLVGTQIKRVYPDGTSAEDKFCPLSDKDIRGTMLIENPFCHSAVLYRRELALETGGYKPVKNLWNINDYELWMQLGLKGEMRNLSDVTTKYTVWPNKMGIKHRAELYWNDFKTACKYKNAYPNFSSAVSRYVIKYPLRKITG